MKENSVSSIQVIDRAVHLLDALAEENDPQSLKVLSAETQLHPSTAFRILAALTAHGLVERTGNGRYQLGVKLLKYASRVHQKVDLLQEAKPIMEWLRSEVDETVNLSVREGDEVVYLVRSVPNRMMRVDQLIGSRAPLHVTAVGKLFLAEGGDKTCNEYVRRTGLPRYTTNTITDALKLQREIQSSSRRGYAFDNEEMEQGVSCIGVPIRDSHGSVVAGLSISAPRTRRRETWIPLIQRAGQEISTRLGYAPKAA
jgi:DNA-binding IclR family transcriptional regulator